MSVQAQTTTSRESYVKTPDDDLYVIHGIAIGENDITVGHKSKTRKRWPKEALESSAKTLVGRHIVKNHENRDIDAVIGQITDAQYVDGKGVAYQGVISDEETANKIEQGWLDVSPRIYHAENMGEDEDGTKVVKDVYGYDNLAVVRQGAAPSNFVDTGESSLMSSDELSAVFDFGKSAVEELKEFEIETADYEELQDLKQHIYDNPEGARGAAEGLPCDGDYHEHEVDDETYYMPCASHEKLLDAVKEKQQMQGEEEAEEADETEEDTEEEELEETEEEEEEELEEEQDSEEDTEGDDHRNATELSQLRQVIGVTDSDSANSIKNNSDLNMTENEELMERLEAQATIADAEPEELTVVAESEISGKEEEVEELRAETSELESEVEELSETVDEQEEEIEELQEEIDVVEDIYAESLAEAKDMDKEFFKKATDSVEELREMFEDEVGEDEGVEELAGTPDPASGDGVDDSDDSEAEELGASEEELERAQELEELAADMENRGGSWGTEAERLREEAAELRGE